MQLIPLLSMVVQLPDYLSESEGLLSGTATFSGDGTDFSTLRLNSRVEVTETILNEVEFEKFSAQLHNRSGCIESRW